MFAMNKFEKHKLKSTRSLTLPKPLSSSQNLLMELTEAMRANNGSRSIHPSEANDDICDIPLREREKV